MAAKRSTAARILVLLARRAGAALGLGIAIAFARVFWDAALEGFAEGIAEGLGGSVIAVVVTGLALVLVYATLGSQVDQVAVRHISLVANKERTNAGRSEVVDGIREAHATWTMLGFAAVALAALSFVSLLGIGVIALALPMTGLAVLIWIALTSAV